MIYHANRNQKKAEVATLIRDKVGFKARCITMDTEEHFIVIKGSIHQKDIKIINTYAPNNRAPKTWQK